MVDFLDGIDREESLSGVPHSRLGRREVLAIALICIIAVSAIYLQLYTRYPVAEHKDVIGILKVEGYIETPKAVSRCTDVISQAILNQSVKAVVLAIDSGGGYADYTERIYLDLLELKAKKPLVASVTMALSGGYYIAVAADYIYVHPTSFVGNIGVIGTGPPILVPSESVLETGVHKITGFSMLDFPYNLSHALDNFVSAVESGRGDRLKLSSIELRRATVYLGSEALNVGLADDVGSVQKAVAKAAQEAKLEKYEVVELEPREAESQASLKGSSNQTSLGLGSLTLKTLDELHPPPAIHYIYLPAQVITQSSASSSPTNSAGEAPSLAKGAVLVDVSHGNLVSWWDLDILIAELAERNATVSFVQSRDSLSSGLANASCLIVASPTELYSDGECKEIGKFLDRGGLLLLFFDPAYEYIGEKGLSQHIIAPINSLSSKFGLSFAKGYLYNEVEHYGIYRNIYVNHFASGPLTSNLSSLVLFTATNIHSLGKGLAWTSDDTYSSVAERTDNYVPIASAEKGNGTVVAFGDLTFLSEPYCYVADNYKLVTNLATIVSEVEVRIEEVEEGGKEKVEVARPDLPVGTEKNFTEWVDGEESFAIWYKVSETEERFDRPNETTHYYLTEDGRLQRWVSDGTECTYEDPLLEPPYPLTKGKSWEYGSDFLLTMEAKNYTGKIHVKEEVEGFEDLEAGDGQKYFCARVRFTEVEELALNGSNMTVVTEGSYWVSSDAGTVKQDATARYYLGGVSAKTVRRTLLLKSIRKGPSL